MLGYFSGKRFHRHLIGEVLQTDKQELRCVICYSMLGDLSQNMGDYDPPLNVLNSELLNDTLSTCGSVSTNLYLPPSYNGSEPHHSTKTCRAPILRTYGYKDSPRHKSTQHCSPKKGCVLIEPSANMR